MSQPTAIRCQGREALIDSGIVSSWTVVTTDSRPESRIVGAYIYPYNFVGDSDVDWCGWGAEIPREEAWIRSGLAGSTELDSAVLVVLGPSQPFRFA